MRTMKKQNEHENTLLDTAVSLKMGDLNTPPVNQIFQKGKRRLETDISKPPLFLSRKIVIEWRFCVLIKIRADNPHLKAVGYRLCVCASGSFTAITFKLLFSL